MRIRNVKNKEEILSSSDKFIDNPKDYKGSWHTLFNNDNEIHIEIGMGKGKFIRSMAKENPNINYIGIEKFDCIIAKAIKRLDEDLPNLYITRFDAQIIDEVFDHEIERIYLNFSDPWPKARHHKRRLTSNEFLKKYHSCFKKDEYINFRTDNKDLFAYSIETLSNAGYTLNDVTFDLHKDKKDIITTEYEDRFTSCDIPIYELKAIIKRKV